MYTATSNYFPVEAATHGAAYMHGAASMPTPFTAPSATMPIWPASTTVSVGYAPKPLVPLMDASAQERADGLSMMMPAPFAAANNGKCVTCGVKSAVNGTANCSRRCSWVAACRCPQCGRGKDPQNPYCSPSCCQQALQANWCPVCGVCQISNSGSCSNTYCAGATMFVCSDNRRSAAKSRPSTANRTPHEVLPASDPTRNQLNSAFVPSFQLGYATRIVSVIKINSIGTHKKRYLSYRSVVESTMSHLGLQKYGHGGEGNEQRRYFALNLQCTLGNVANGGHPGSNLQCCGNPTCEACQILTRGMNLQEMNRGSHYSTTTVQQSLPWTNPNPSGLRAILAARVVVGNADVVVLDPSDAAAPEINFPTNPDLVHSTILTNTDPSQDGTYVFRDDAVDPLFIVLVE